jgi:hypothetical protein
MYLFFGVPAIEKCPSKGSAILVWDSGPENNTPPPLTNAPPEEGPNGEDPHGDPRSTVAARQQKSDFLKREGRITDVCGGQPCHTDEYSP